MLQPYEHILPEKEQLVCKLKKILYGLKQAPRQWYLKFERFMVSSDFTRLEAVTASIPSGSKISISCYWCTFMIYLLLGLT